MRSMVRGRGHVKSVRSCRVDTGEGWTSAGVDRGPGRRDGSGEWGWRDGQSYRSVGIRFSPARECREGERDRETEAETHTQSQRGEKEEAEERRVEERKRKRERKKEKRKEGNR